MQEIDTFKDKVDGFIRTWIIDIAVAIILIVYIVKAIATTGLTDKTVWGILADGALAFIFATAVAKLLRQKGFLSGKSDERFLSTLSAYGEQFMRITPNIEELENFCIKKNEENMRVAVTNELANYGISYEMYAKGIDNPTELQSEAITKVRKLKVFKLTARDLTSENSSNLKFGLGKTVQEYSGQKNIMDISLTLITAIIFGAFTLKMIDDFSVSAIVWACVQVVFFFIKGVSSYVSAFMFITEDYRNRIIRKTNLLNEFENIIKKSPIIATKGE